MIAFLVSLFSNQKVRTVSIYILLILGVLWGLRQYTNKAYSDGRTAGVNASLAESVATSTAGWKAELSDLQKQLVTAQQVSLVAARAAVEASKRADAIRVESNRAIQAIPNQVASLPNEALPARLVENDAHLTNLTDNTEALQRALLESQLTNKEIITELRQLQANWQEYTTNTQDHIDSLTDELHATQGQLKVMTQERDSYKASFEIATKKRGCGTFKKILTLGICR